MTKRLTTLIAAALAPVLFGAPVTAPPRKQALLMAMKANAQQITQYQWKQRITVVRKGTPLEPTIQEIRFDASGQPVRTTLAKPEERRMGPLRAKKAGEIKESIQEAMQLALRYAAPPNLASAIQRGELWEGPATLRVRAQAVVLPADEMEITVDNRDFLMTKVDAKTWQDGHPVAIAIVYEHFPNGPCAMRRMTVRMPEEDIIVNVESFDFVLLAGQTIH